MDYKDFCIFVPVYNEIDCLARLEAVLSDYVGKHQGTTVLLVDDGSDDGSLSAMEEMCARNEAFSCVASGTNKGLSAAMKTAIGKCDKKYLGYIDADLQTLPDDFDLLIPYVGDFQLVSGYRLKRNDGLVKRVSSRIGNAVRRYFTHDGVADTGCPLKVIDMEVARSLPMFDGMHRFLPALVQMTGGRVKCVGVRHFPREAGRSKYGVRNRIVRPLADCFAVRWMRKRYIRI